MSWVLRYTFSMSFRSNDAPLPDGEYTLYIEKAFKYPTKEFAQNRIKELGLDDGTVEVVECQDRCYVIVWDIDDAYEWSFVRLYRHGDFHYATKMPPPEKRLTREEAVSQLRDLRKRDPKATLSLVRIVSR